MVPLRIETLTLTYNIFYKFELGDIAHTRIKVLDLRHGKHESACGMFQK